MNPLLHKCQCVTVVVLSLTEVLILCSHWHNKAGQLTLARVSLLDKLLCERTHELSRPSSLSNSELSLCWHEASPG